MNGLLKSRKFYLACFGVIQTIVFQYLPAFPKEVWQSINVLVMVLIAGIAFEDGFKTK